MFRPKSRFLARLSFAAVLAAATHVRAAPAPAIFITPSSAASSIYHDGWIDSNKNGRLDLYEDPTMPVDRRIDDLLAQMTLEEKTAQMVTLYGFPRVLKDELPTPAWKKSFWKDGIGNIDEHMNGNTGGPEPLPSPAHDLPYSRHARAINEVQRFFIEETRLGIPADFTNEGIRGLLHSKATSFPAQLAVASAWNRELVGEIGRITGREARALGYTNVYSPILDLPRDPRWGRIIECYSEDPFLTSTLGVEQVRGIQEQRVVSTLKHFAIYSTPKGGRDGEARTDPQVTWREAQMIFLEPFRRAIREGGALGVMASYNDYDGIPVEGSRQFLTDILRTEYGFTGYVVSDSGAVEFIHLKHRVAASPAEAIRQAVDAGLNVRTNFTAPEEYAEPLRDLVRKGAVSPGTIDVRVRDVLRVKFWLGLFDTPYVVEPAAADTIVRNPAHVAVAERAARESIILLKNESAALPLRKDLRRILVTGPLAHDPSGWWSRYGPQKIDFVTPLEGIRAKLGSSVDVRYAQGCTVVDERYPESDVLRRAPTPAAQRGIHAAVAAAADVDVIIAVLGETEDYCAESASRISLDLPGDQQALLEALHETGKPIVLVLSNGRPLSVNWAAEHVPAIVEMWFPGEAGGAALADVLFGDYNPAGRLPVTVPKSVGQIPLNFPAHPGSQGHDRGQVFGPLYPFGHGLSYTTFDYASLEISPQRGGPGGEFVVRCTVTNTGDRAGDEVVQLYIRDDFSSVVTFEQVLRGFERIHLKPGESRRVSFRLRPEDLMLYDRSGQWTVEPGRFTIWVGASSTDLRLRGDFLVTDESGHAPEESIARNHAIDPR